MLSDRHVFTARQPEGKPYIRPPLNPPPPPETSTIVIDKGTKSPPGKKQDTALPDWKTSKKLYMAVFILAVISLTAALNTTPLGFALLVGHPRLIEWLSSANTRCHELLRRNLGDPQSMPSGPGRLFYAAPPSFNRISLPSPTSSVANS